LGFKIYITKSVWFSFGPVPHTTSRLSNRGLLSTDAALLLHPATSAYVAAQANATSSAQFFADFAASFVAMSRLGVLTHHKGEIRQVCSKVNPPAPTTTNAGAGAGRSYYRLTTTAGLALITTLAVADLLM